MTGNNTNGKILKLQSKHIEMLENSLNKEEFDKIWNEIYPHLEIESQVSKCCKQLKEIYDYVWKISKKESWAVNYNCSECGSGWIYNYEISSKE